MSIVNFRNLRGIVILLSVVIGVASTIATGGGGGSSDSPGGTADTDPTLAITTTNGEDVSSAVVIAIGVSFDLGDLTGDDLIAQAAGHSLNLSGLKSLGPVYLQLASPFSGVVENCAIEGIVDVTITASNPNAPTVGDQIVAIFDTCDDNDGYVISGTVDLTIAELQGDLNSDVFLIGFDVILTDIVVTEGTETVTSEGTFTLTIDSLDFPAVKTSLVGDELQFGAGGEVITMIDFDHSLTVDIGVIPDTKLAEVFGRLVSQVLGGSVDYETITPIQAIGDFDPHTGEMLITGADGSSVRIIIVDSANITLEIDTNGDGVIDQYVETSWAALNNQNAPDGEASLISSSTAPTVAREVFNGVTGFGLVTVTGGNQFISTAVFGQIQQQAVSGDFDLLAIDCASGGSANVSGSISTAGTFSPNDELSATFTACSRSNEVLNGEIDVVVGSFVQSAGNAFLVTGTVSQTDLKRTIGGSCYWGTGTFDTSYDSFYSTAGTVNVSNSASSFAVSAGGRTQNLSDATANADVTVGQQFPIISRESSGNITSEDLNGSFSYESISPAVFHLDDDSGTGPYSGELLVTASDDSNMRMVAVDEYNVRLDIDVDGDSIVDEEIATTWATLGYGNVFGICD